MSNTGIQLIFPHVEAVGDSAQPFLQCVHDHAFINPMYQLEIRHLTYPSFVLFPLRSQDFQFFVVFPILVDFADAQTTLHAFPNPAFFKRRKLISAA